MSYAYEAATGSKLGITRCDEGHLMITAVSWASDSGIPVCVAAQDAPGVLDEMCEWAQIETRASLLAKVAGLEAENLRLNRQLTAKWLDESPATFSGLDGADPIRWDDDGARHASEPSGSEVDTP